MLRAEVFVTGSVFVSCTEEKDDEKLKVLPKFVWLMVGYAWLRFIGMKRMELVSKNSN